MHLKSALVVVATTLAAGRFAHAACHVAAVTTTGDGSGKDWNNLCSFVEGGTCDPSATTGTSMLVRGDTYYLAGGGNGAALEYPFAGWDTPASGAATVTVKGVTDQDNCTSVGYSHAAFFGQADFLLLPLRSDYWIVDGNHGDETCALSNAYGRTSPFDIAPCTNGSFGILVDIPRANTGTTPDLYGIEFGQGENANPSSHSTVRQVEVVGLSATSAAGSGSRCDAGEVMYAGSNDDVLEGAYFHGLSDGTMIANGVNESYLHNWWAPNHLGMNSQPPSDCHTEIFNYKSTFTSGFIVYAYNVLINPAGTAFGNNPTPNPRQNELAFLSNIFVSVDPTGYAPDTQIGDGAIFNENGIIGSIYVLHNDILNVAYGTPNFANDIANVHDGGLQPSIANAYVQNNLFWNDARGTGYYGGVTGTDAQDHNACFSTAPGCTAASDQVGTLDPFLSSGGGDFRLAGTADPTMPGVDETAVYADVGLQYVDWVGTPYEVASPSRGAFQFTTASIVDAGVDAADGGTRTIDPSSDGGTGTPPSNPGCGCTITPAPSPQWLSWLTALAALRRRRHPR